MLPADTAFVVPPERTVGDHYVSDDAPERSDVSADAGPNADADPEAGGDATDAEPDRDPAVEAYENWPVDGGENVDYLGRTAGPASETDPASGSEADPASGPEESAVYYDREESAVYEGSLGEKAGTVHLGHNPVYDLSPGETLGDALEAIGETSGWESLSEFARDKLKGDEDRPDGDSRDRPDEN